MLRLTELGGPLTLQNCTHIKEIKIKITKKSINNQILKSILMKKEKNGKYFFYFWKKKRYCEKVLKLFFVKYSKN